ncbi:MAG: DUF1844 domain-containing protein [Bacteroidota bacterium]
MDLNNLNNEKIGPEQKHQLLMMMLIQQYQQIAMVGLGKMVNPQTEKSERDLSAARFAIDTLAMLESFTKGNLSQDLSDFLTQTLTNLRLNYADEKKKEPSTKDSGDDSTDDSGDQS